MSAYRAVKQFKIKGAPVLPGAILQLTEEVAAKLAGYVVPDTPGECIATSRMVGEECHITYAPDLYQKYRHRDGDQINIVGASITLRVGESHHNVN